jgi:uncharacterized protein YdhG (YjbR/CyaY superfamily)
MTAPATVDAYLAAQPAPARAALTRVRAALRKALPGAEETISYSIPALRLGGRMVIYFAGWKAHWSLYPFGEAVRAAFGEALLGLEFSKGTIRFPLDRPVPVGLVQRLARYRAAEVAGLGPAKSASTARRSAREPAARKARPVARRGAR